MNINASNILIVGLGMIGSSIALACKSKGIHVKAFDIDKSVYEDALKNNVIDESVEFFENINSLEFVSDIDLIVIAVPPKQTLEVINKLNLIWNTGTTITDTSSVKNHIKLENVNNIVLSHPIAGSDKSGLSAADPNLFNNKKNVI